MTRKSVILSSQLDGDVDDMKQFEYFSNLVSLVDNDKFFCYGGIK